MASRLESRPVSPLLDAARNEGVQSLSLSVEEDNPAVRLYERCGFVKVELIDNAWAMKADLTRPAV